MPSSFGAGNLIGSFFESVARQTDFDPGVRVIEQEVSDAFAEPTSTPEQDQLRFHDDGASVVAWWYNATDDEWYGQWIQTRPNTRPAGATTVTAADSPYTPSLPEDGVLEVDTSGGAVTIAPDDQTDVGVPLEVKVIDATNSVTIDPAGTTNVEDPTDGTMGTTTSLSSLNDYMRWYWSGQSDWRART